MKIIHILAALAAVVLGLGACTSDQVSTSELAEARSNIGKNAVFERDILVVQFFSSTQAVEAAQENSIGNARIVKRLPRGSRVSLERIVRRVNPPGVMYYYLCRSEEHDAFELPLSMSDSIRILQSAASE